MISKKTIEVVYPVPRTKKKTKPFTILVDYFFTYSTERAATIQSKKVGLVYRLAQLLILAYIIGWDFIINKSYQSTDSVSSTVTSKVKGQGYLPLNMTQSGNLFQKASKQQSKSSSIKDGYKLRPTINYLMYDTADYVIPPNEYNSIFIMTNFIKTKQRQDRCDEDIMKFRAECKEDADCTNLGDYTHLWNGLPTGKCIDSTTEAGKKVCEITGWCPTEKEHNRTEDNLIRNVLNFTIFIKNDVEFKKFNKKMRNILPNITNNYISQCNYHPVEDPYCPVFLLDDVLTQAEPDAEDRYQMLVKGAVILIEIIWDCNLDFSNSCFPKYEFRRFDTKETNTASGFNFRFANKYYENHIEYRILYKAYGLRFLINVSGSAGKFNIVPFLLSIGAGIGLMSLSVIAADCVMLNCTNKKEFYQEIKELKAHQAFIDTHEIVRL